MDENDELMDAPISLGIIINGSFRDITKLNGAVEALVERTGCRIVYRTRSGGKLFISEGRS